MERRRKRESAISIADRFAALPDGVHAQIVSLLPYWDVIQLYAVCRAWRRLALHRAAAVVNIDLREFAMFGRFVPASVVLGHRSALRRIRCKVEELDLSYYAGDRCMNEEANAIINTVDTHNISITVSYGPGDFRTALARGMDKWDLDMPSMATDLQVQGCGHRAPVVYGDNLRVLDLYQLEIHDAPRLPSLRSLTLQSVKVAGKVPFAPGEWCPHLEELRLEHDCTVENRLLDIRLPLLKLLVMEEVHVESPLRDDADPYGRVAVDTPVLEELVVIGTTGFVVEFESFTLRAPVLRRLIWGEQYAERVVIDVGMPGSVTEGKIEFMSNGELDEMSRREIKYYRAQLMQMLRGILPDVPPSRIADVARPSMKVRTTTVVDEDTGETIPEERITCNLRHLISSHV
uniref:F-box domain-containing protein n=1 Tax=Leersia perrieri TaxID=77586 RepID=A0A0D9WX56_9ORYZ